jgi:hypothetical protein
MLPIPRVPVAGQAKPIPFFVLPNVERRADGHTPQAYLVLRAICHGETRQKALAVAHWAAHGIVKLLAFFHNTAIAAPELWHAVRLAPGDKWLEIVQYQYEDLPARLAQYFRFFTPELFAPAAIQLYSKNPDDAEKIDRAIDLYNEAIRGWELQTEIPAAHLLFMAAEGLTDIALRLYCEREGKTVEQLKAPLLEAERQNLISKKNKKATDEDRRNLEAILSRVGDPGLVVNRVDSTLKSEARKQIIFAEAPEAHQALKAATDGLEHGFRNAEEIRAKINAHVDRAATCIRNFILNHAIPDVALVAELTSARWAAPLPIRRHTLTADCLIRLPDKAAPFTSPGDPPLKFRNVRWMNESDLPAELKALKLSPHQRPLDFDVESNIAGAEIRDVKHSVQYVPFSLADQANQVPKELAAMVGYVPSDGQ